MLIHITKQDIEQGIKKSLTHCPIGLSIRRQYPNLWVCVLTPYLEINSTILHFDKPTRQFIIDFDQGKSVQPFSIDSSQCQIDVSNDIKINIFEELKSAQSE